MCPQVRSGRIVTPALWLREPNCLQGSLPWTSVASKGKLQSIVFSLAGVFVPLAGWGCQNLPSTSLGSLMNSSWDRLCPPPPAESAWLAGPSAWCQASFSPALLPFLTGTWPCKAQWGHHPVWDTPTGFLCAPFTIRFQNLLPEAGWQGGRHLDRDQYLHAAGWHSRGFHQSQWDEGMEDRGVGRAGEKLQGV